MAVNLCDVLRMQLGLLTFRITCFGKSQFVDRHYRIFIFVGGLWDAVYYIRGNRVTPFLIGKPWMHDVAHESIEEHPVNNVFIH